MVKYGYDLVLVTPAMKEEMVLAGVPKDALRGKVLVNTYSNDLCRLSAGCYGTKYYFSSPKSMRSEIKQGIKQWELRTGRQVRDL